MLPPFLTLSSHRFGFGSNQRIPVVVIYGVETLHEKAAAAADIFYEFRYGESLRIRAAF
jgi:hypothetical protein